MIHTFEELARRYPVFADEVETAELDFNRNHAITPRQFCALVGKRTNIPTNYQSERGGVANHTEPCAYKLPSEICALGSVWRRWERVLRTLADAIDCPVTRGACLNALNGVSNVGGDVPEFVKQAKRALAGLGVTVGSGDDEDPFSSQEGREFAMSGSGKGEYGEI